MAADSFVDGTEDFDGKAAIDERHFRGRFVVAGLEVAAGEESSACRLNVAGRDVIVHGVGSEVGGAEVGGGVGVDVGVAASQA